MYRQSFLFVFLSIASLFLFIVVTPDILFFDHNIFLIPQSNHDAFASSVNGPFITKYSNDISEKNIFKVTVEVTGLNKSIGLINTCIYADSSLNAKINVKSLKPNICHISNMTQEYLHYFPNDNCPSCIVPIGTVVFPQSEVPEGTKVTVCVMPMTKKTSTCNYAINRQGSYNENVLITLP